MDQGFHKDRKRILPLYFFQLFDPLSFNPLFVYRKLFRCHRHFFIRKNKIKRVDIFIFPAVFPKKPCHIFQTVFISGTKVIRCIVPDLFIPGSSRIHIINLFQGFVQIFYCLLHPSVQDPGIVFFDHPCRPEIKYHGKGTSSKHGNCQDRQQDFCPDAF